jgi:hypothetical protein
MAFTLEFSDCYRMTPCGTLIFVNHIICMLIYYYFLWIKNCRFNFLAKKKNDEKARLGLNKENAKTESNLHSIHM